MESRNEPNALQTRVFGRFGGLQGPLGLAFVSRECEAMPLRLVLPVRRDRFHFLSPAR